MFELLARIGMGLAGLIGIAAVGLIIYGIVDKQNIKRKLQDQGIKRAIVTAVDNCSNVVSLSDLDSNKKIEIRGESISKDIKKDTIITV